MGGNMREREREMCLDRSDLSHSKQWTALHSKPRHAYHRVARAMEGLKDRAYQSVLEEVGELHGEPVEREQRTQLVQHSHHLAYTPGRGISPGP